MLQSKVGSEMTEMKVKSVTRPARNAQLQHLQDEIDKLALLVNEAKRQSDRIQAAADALGDAVLIGFEAGISSVANDKRARLRKIDS
ncbi:MAG TPA: hypothetical protein VJQ54_10600 [Candidatus Sulfotelmatobacter sp.]|nr:hypothetical protein [Candidatus Sulfotelmatobacter sp.]